MERPDRDDEALIRRLRALPPEGTEPDWQTLEAQIRAEVGDRAPLPWWRRWTWIVPIWALATTAAVALIVTRDQPRAAEPASSTRPALTAPIGHERGGVAAERPEADSVWLDGEALELDDVDGATLDELDAETRAALDRESDDETDGILPISDLSWVDGLDDNALDRAEHWLTRKRS